MTDHTSMNISNRSTAMKRAITLWVSVAIAGITLMACDHFIPFPGDPVDPGHPDTTDTGNPRDTTNHGPRDPWDTTNHGPRDPWDTTNHA